MNNRIEEVSDFEGRIRDNPIELFKKIKEKMYDPARAKYKYISLTELFSRLINDTKQ